MAQTDLPPIPHKIPVVDLKTGLLQMMWAKWFDQIMYRVGGNVASTNTELAVSVTAGDGLTGGSGSSLAVDVDNSTIEISVGNKVRQKDAGTTEAKLATSAKVGRVVQDVFTMSGAVSTGTTTVPLDDTIPQNTEGDEYLTRSITPIATTSRLVIEAEIFVASNTANVHLIAALFQDSTANALATVAQLTTAIDGVQKLTLKHEMAAGTTSATTFKVRAGPSAAATVTLNGANAARLFGGVTLSSLRVTERTPT